MQRHPESATANYEMGYIYSKIYLQTGDSSFGYIAGLFVSYIYGRIWVFGKRFRASKYRLFLFACVYLVGGIIMSIVIGFLNNQFEIDYRICWIIGASFAVLNNFFGQKFIVFRKLG